jgi:hypothetical protein
MHATFSGKPPSANSRAPYGAAGAPVGPGLRPGADSVERGSRPSSSTDHPLCRRRRSPDRGHRGGGAAPRCCYGPSGAPGRAGAGHPSVAPRRRSRGSSRRSPSAERSAQRGLAVCGSGNTHPGCALPAHSTGSPLLLVWSIQAAGTVVPAVDELADAGGEVLTDR